MYAAVGCDGSVLFECMGWGLGCASLMRISRRFASKPECGHRRSIFSFAAPARFPLLFDHRSTHKPLSSSFLGLPYRILNINHKKELLRGLWVNMSRSSLLAVAALSELPAMDAS